MKLMLGLKNETQRKVKLLNSGHCSTGGKLFMANVSISLSVKTFSQEILLMKLRICLVPERQKYCVREEKSIVIFYSPESYRD